jgi:hypothetical protein
VADHSLLVPDQRETKMFYSGDLEIKAIFVNSQDYAYLENTIDPVSLRFFLENILKIEDDDTRALIWFNINQMVRRGLIRLDDYVDFVVGNLFDEPMDVVLNKMLMYLLNFLDGFVQ